MNGYATFTLMDGQEVSVNSDLVRYVKNYHGRDPGTVIYFEKDHFLVVAGSLQQTASLLSAA